MQNQNLGNTSAESEVNVVMPFEKKGEFFIEDIGGVPEKPVYSFIKRAIDITASAIALIILFIPMLLIALLIVLDSKGGVFYCQERLGKNGKKFNVIKFRSMCADAEKGGAQWSQGTNDTRITKIGSVLRKTRLDELPQLWCILKGDMTIVGPRPEREVFYNEFETYIHGFIQRTKVTPGLTGLAQIKGGYDLKPEEKILFDIEYIKTRSLWLDIKIIFRTVKVVFTHEGAK